MSYLPKKAVGTLAEQKVSRVSDVLTTQIAQQTVSPALEAYYRSSASQILLPGVRTPLIIDGLHSTSYNKLPWDVWDRLTSRIRVSKAGELYIVRVNFNTSSGTTSVLTLDLDIGGAVGIVFQKSLQPYDLTNFLSSETFSLFTGSTFVTNGGVLNVTATEKTTISDANLFIIKFAHNYGQF